MSPGHALVSSELLELPNFRLFAVCLAVLGVKMLAVASFTGMTRGRLDAEGKMQPATFRGVKAHLNDLENIPLFLVVALTAVLAGAHPLTVEVSILAFTVTRVLHTVFYVGDVPPLRSASWVVNLLATVALMAVTVARCG